MSDSNSLQRSEGGAIQQHATEAYGLAEVLNQKRLVNDLLRKVMVVNVHYGTIPGCGDKYALLKPGAETIGFTFRLAPEYAITKRDLPNEHQDIQVICTLRNISTGQVWGQGVGSCSSMENKFRYQTKSTGKAVPEEYWQARDKTLLGGPQYAPKKVGGSYVIFETIETENPLDKGNTFLKIAKKRAHIDAILTATAASDIFTQDLEIEDEDEGTMPRDNAPADNPPQTRGKPPTANRPPSGGTKTPPANQNAQAIDWRSVVAHFPPKLGNKTLGEVADDPATAGSIWFLATQWNPRRDAKDQIINPKDNALKLAANAAHAELEQAKKDMDAERGGDDNVPM